MKLREIPKEDLELMGYDDIAIIILQDSGKKMKLADIFKKICNVLNLPEGNYEEQLMEFFEQMSINKKVVMLENGYWDLQTRHNSDIVIEDGDEDEDIVDDVNSELEEDSDSEEDIFYEKEEDTDDVDEDDLGDLMIVDDSEETNLE